MILACRTKTFSESEFQCQAVGCGEWKRPKIRNPAFKGKWYPPKIKNPAYKGPWSARKVCHMFLMRAEADIPPEFFSRFQIPNPDWFEDLKPHNLHPISAVGFELLTNSGNPQARANYLCCVHDEF